MICCLCPACPDYRAELSTCICFSDLEVLRLPAHEQLHCQLTLCLMQCAVLARLTSAMPFQDLGALGHTMSRRRCNCTRCACRPAHGQRLCGRRFTAAAHSLGPSGRCGPCARPSPSTCWCRFHSGRCLPSAHAPNCDMQSANARRSGDEVLCSIAMSRHAFICMDTWAQ